MQTLSESTIIEALSLMQQLLRLKIRQISDALRAGCVYKGSSPRRGCAASVHMQMLHARDHSSNSWLPRLQTASTVNLHSTGSIIAETSAVGCPTRWALSGSRCREPHQSTHLKNPFGAQAHERHATTS